MKNCALLLLVLAISAGAQAPTVAAAPAVSAACTFPTTPAPTSEETAWRVFVAANCAAGQGKLTWETWTEQLDIFPAGGTAGGAQARPGGKRLHGSFLALLNTAGAARPGPEITSRECNAMKRAPRNVVSNARICEEVRLNPTAQAYITSQGYQVRAGQSAAAEKQSLIDFPSAAISMKVDWLPASDFNPPFSCSKPPAGVHVETIEGQCYAMAGVALASKLMPDWLWATFEPQNMLTNPLRCISFEPCRDNWGSIPAISKGRARGFTKPTPALVELMKAANLPPEFLNYRLNGVQTAFTNADGSPTFLGNSVIEGENAGLLRGQDSCITCHSASSIQNNGTDGVTLLPGLHFPIGPQYKVPAGWIARDFAWSLALACPDAPNGIGFQKCTGAFAGSQGK